MKRRIISLLFITFGLTLLAAGAFADVRLTVRQLYELVRSSIELRHPDEKVADYLKNVKLSERLDERIVEELQGLGAGPRTVHRLKELVEESKNLPAPKSPVGQTQRRSTLPPPSSDEQERILELARHYARNYVQNLPDFICLQVIRRYVDPSGREFWSKQDEIVTRVSYVEQREDYKVITINNRYADIEYEELGGATSAGEFGSMMRALFAEETQARFAWDRWATLRGRRAHVYRYEVDRSHSQWTITYERTLRIRPGYRGYVYVDAETYGILRITMEAVGIPASFPIQEASTILDFDYVDIGGRDYLLPLRARVFMREGRLLARNDIEFRRYRKFSAEAVITFDTTVPEPLTDQETEEQK